MVRILKKSAPLLAFRLLNLYRTTVRRRDLKSEISRRFSASAWTDNFVISPNLAFLCQIVFFLQNCEKTIVILRDLCYTIK